jgi:hypothetical protein
VDEKGVAWFYTRNPEFFSHKHFPGIRTQSEHPVASFEGQLNDSFKPCLGDYLDARSNGSVLSCLRRMFSFFKAADNT